MTNDIFCNKCKVRILSTSDSGLESIYDTLPDDWVNGDALGEDPKDMEVLCEKCFQAIVSLNQREYIGKKLLVVSSLTSEENKQEEYVGGVVEKCALEVKRYLEEKEQ